MHEIALEVFSSAYACGCLGKGAQSRYDHGLVHLANGNKEAAFELANELAEYVSKKPSEEKYLPSEYCLTLGLTYSEALNYAKAIEYLSKAIEKDPSNSQAHLARAIAYFETSQFDAALQDYTYVKIDPILPLPQKLNVAEYSQGFLIGAHLSFKLHLSEFPATMWNSLKGISHLLWLGARNPMQVPQGMMDIGIM